MVKVNLFALGSLVASALAASLNGDTAAIEISDTRITGSGGVFREGETVTGTSIATGGMIVADDDSSFVNEIRNAWRNAHGVSSGIYYELQEVKFVIYPDQSKPWPDAKFAVYLPPFS